MFLSFLASCGQPQNWPNAPAQDATGSDDTSLNTESTSSGSEVSQTVSSGSTLVADAQGKVLKIDPKCVGCGHCIRFASSNFKMNFQNHKAEVISQENLESDGVQQAINRCPVSAISIG